MSQGRKLDERLTHSVGEYITNYQLENGKSPARRSMADKLKITLPKLHRHIHALANSGRIELSGDGTIVMPRNLDLSRNCSVAIVGDIRCGQPTLAVNNIQKMLAIPTEFTGKGGSFFIVMAEGDSMEGAGIMSGDYLIIREQHNAEIGDIVVAVRESDYGAEEVAATLKRYKQKDGKYVLHAESDSDEYEDLDAKDFRIMGKLVSFVRKL